jgi:hypothetical protein
MASAAEQLETFKSYYPNLAHVQALTLDNVNTAFEGQLVDWNAVTPAHFAPSPAVSIPPCQKAVGFVIFDVISLAVGAVGLRSSVQRSTIEAMAEAAAPVLSKIETIIAQMGQRMLPWSTSPGGSSRSSKRSIQVARWEQSSTRSRAASPGGT